MSPYGSVAIRRAATFLLASAMLVGCGGKKDGSQQGPPPARVSVYQVRQGAASYYDVYPASVVALKQVELRPEVSGYITGIYFKDGQHVPRGMKLYGIDQQQYKAAYDQAQANLNVAKANLEKVQQDVDRYNELAKADAIAKQTLEHAQADLQSARMQVAAAEANVQNVNTNLRNSVIYAPFDCTIGVSLVQIGSAVTAGQTLLNTISSDDPMAVDCAVDEKEINRFSRMLESDPPPGDSTFTLVPPDRSVYPLPGQLRFMDRAVDPQTGTIRVRVAFPNPQGVLKPGMTCDLRIRTMSPSSSLLIPYRAVVEQMGEYFVFLVSGNRALERKVTLGPRVSDMVIVTEGVKAGDQVVIEGTQRLKDSTLVAVVPPSERPDTSGPMQGK